MLKCERWLITLAMVILGFFAHAQTPEWMWAFSAGSTGENEGNPTIKVAESGNIYIAGGYSASFEMGSFILPSSNEKSIYIAKLNPDGVVQWVYTYGATSISVVLDIDANENIVLAGEFEGLFPFGGQNQSQGYDLYFAKLSSTGELLWTNSAYGSDHDYVRSISVSENGNIYIAGNFHSTLTFGATTIQSSAHNYNSSGYLAKLTGNGVWLWSYTYGGTDSTFCWDIDVDDNHDVYITGVRTPQGGPARAFIGKFDSYGQVVWTKIFGGYTQSSAVGKYLVVGSDNFIYTSGEQYGSFGYQIPSIGDNLGQNDVYITKMDTNGNWIWVTSIRSTGNDIAPYIDIDSEGSLYLSGLINYLSFFGTESYSPDGITDMYLAKIDTSGAWEYVLTSGATGVTNSFTNAPMGTDVYIGGVFTGEWTLPCNNFSSNQSFDFYIAKLGYYPISASFIVDDVIGSYPQTVNFTDTSNGGNGIITDWFWDFGDGTTSEDQNPSHTYDEVGVYSISLTITNSRDSVSVYTASDLVIVIDPDPVVELISPNYIDFGEEVINDYNDYCISIVNKGEYPLEVSSAYANTSHFVIVSPLPFSLLYGEQMDITIRFSPQSIGSITDTLIIVNNSINSPAVHVRLTGYGMYSPPLPPSDISITMVGYDAQISWGAVTANTHGLAITPDYYFVYFNGSDDVNGLYYFLGRSFSTQYTHLDVGLGAQHMFYKIKAIKLYREQIVPLITSGWDGIPDDNIRYGMTEAEVEEAIRQLY